MTDIVIRKTGRGGHITLNRPKALNALTWNMCLAIEGALDDWRGDPDVALIIIDGLGDRAFCAGGDIAEMYVAGKRGDLTYGRRFWRDEYRLNAKLFNYPKPIVTFLHGFTMGGGVGVGCHASHRIVCEDSQIAMPECSIGLVPDVGGSLILAKTPGHCGEYLGLSGDRMDAGDALYAGFADYFVPHDRWQGLKITLLTSGDVNTISAHPTPPARLADWQSEVDDIFAGTTLSDIDQRIGQSAGPAATQARRLMDRNAPLAMAVGTQVIKAARSDPNIKTTLDREFRFTHRCVAQGDFIEGIRAAIIDRDKAPKWQHAQWGAVTKEDIAKMTQDLGANALQWKDKT